ncbi:DUF4179 domain-containing protein [Bacillus sp. FJAT-50079]|uniref:DUF4179 domain-containing protein n=1 Tax=Bacillus sp. FJAT-50079 TaxID=2833577 RepID=UPI001BC9FC47|nr:DUF4179 domain-containing protein [Bacillus sp. FJAT-50079]MBS4209545.1 DUF4179 domain-containing protein [Bacillus sp. FJAT-50079]
MLIPAKIDSISINTIKEKGIEPIVDWFDQHKRSLYALGLVYFKNQQQMEELFYQSIIKVHNELPRFTKETSFEMLVTSIFIHTCRELSKDLQVSEEIEQSWDLFKALDHLEEYEKEALILTFIIGFSKEETAHLLQISVEKLKEYLFAGIQSIRKEMGYGSSFNGCKKYHQYYIDYLERTLDRSKKIDFEMHIYHCEDCQDDLGTFQDVMLHLNEGMGELNFPSGFMENVKGRLAEKEKHRQQKNKKHKRVGLVFASVFALLIGIEFFTGAFSNLYYTWIEEDQELRAFMKHNLGERLNLEAESDGIKIRIKRVIADDVQTLIFYEIVDTAEDNQYMLDYYEGVSVENKLEIMNRETYLKYYPPDLHSDVNNKEKNVYQGRISLLPLKTNSGTIELKITKLFKMIRDSTESNHFMNYEYVEHGTGEWNFEIPVTKQPSIEYKLDKEIEVEGVPIQFDQLTVAPTVTILHYTINPEQLDKRIEHLKFAKLEVNNKKVEAHTFDSFLPHPNGYEDIFQAHFDPLLGEKPKEVNIQFESIHLMFEDQKTIELGASEEYPQTIEYAGSTILIDMVEDSQFTNVDISNHEIENRAFEWLYLYAESENENNSMEMDSEGVFVDKNGIEYGNEYPFSYEEMEQPRYFFTVQRIRFRGNNNGENENAKRLVIYGYNSTKYLDDVVKISLE